MFSHPHWDPAKWEFVLSTDFGITVFSMMFISWTLLIINLFFVTLWFVHYFFGTNGIFRKKS